METEPCERCGEPNDPYQMIMVAKRTNLDKPYVELICEECLTPDEAKKFKPQDY